MFFQCLIFILSFFQLLQCLVIPDTNLTLAIAIKDNLGLNHSIDFQFTLYEANIQDRIIEFCKEYELSEEDCQIFYDKIVEIKYNYAETQQLKLQLEKNYSIVNTQFIPNPHLLRTSLSANSEMENHFKNEDKIFKMNQIIDGISQQSSAQLLSILLNQTSRQQSPRLIVIHSCSLPHEKNRILLDILQHIGRSGLFQFLDQILIFNYGIPISISIDQDDSNLKISIFNVSDEIIFFEVPTMIIMHRIALELVKYSLGNSQILYLHTKGVSYKQIYQQIEDWRNFMLYFLIDKHQTCYHLLASGEFDAIGANYKSSPRDFRGNFWWASSNYISSLKPLYLQDSTKYSAEQWALYSKFVRVYNFHESEVDHHFTVYPYENYQITDSDIETRKEYFPNIYSSEDFSLVTLSAICKSYRLYYKNSKNNEIIY